MLKRLSLICLILIVLATLSGSFHHHDDGSEHPECAVCFAVHHHTITPVTVLVPESLSPVTVTRYLAPVLAVWHSTSFTPFNNRAPPV